MASAPTKKNAARMQDFFAIFRNMRKISGSIGNEARKEAGAPWLN